MQLLDPTPSLYEQKRVSISLVPLAPCGQWAQADHYLLSYESGTPWGWLVMQGMAVIFVARRTEASMTSHWKRVIRAQ